MRPGAFGCAKNCNISFVVSVGIDVASHGESEGAIEAKGRPARADSTSVKSHDKSQSKRSAPSAKAKFTIFPAEEFM